MMLCNESRKEAAGLTPFLTPRKTIRLATWNIRTMYEAGRTAQVAKEMKHYNTCLLGLSETRWLQTGQLRLTTGETLFTKKSKIKLNIIQCYAPTNDTDDEKKDAFYQQLPAVLDKAGKKYMAILMGDFNAKIGADNTGYNEVMGTQGLGYINENGERFADLCSLNQLVIGGSIFPHKRIHKATWRSPDHVTENQIDHICISKKFRRAWKDVKVMRGTDISSDHHLLMTAVRLHLKKFKNTTNMRTRYNVSVLKTKEVRTAFHLSLSNRFQPLQDQIENNDTNIETQWKLEARKEKKVVLNTSRTRAAKAKAQEDYTATDKEVKKNIRKDKRDHINNLAKQAEEAAGQGNLR
ncbi:craniofacial development protein 2-like [Ostrea edulis]|uniref:craniofacial development protein 2-like n=1 Tax=Ostrea edulis TaxID=37623 RepID=UPI0024AFE484|nr:craniofacial development protein 2-like [Ostrea edulis]